MLVLTCSTAVAPCPAADQFWRLSSEVVTVADFGVTTETILYVITWGFGVVLLGFLLGWGIGLAVGLIKKL